MTIGKYWGYQRDWCKLKDCEFETKLEAIHSAEDEYEDEYALKLANGQGVSEVCSLVNYDICEETGSIIERSREPYTLYAEGYHGDLKEHGTWQ